jgi:hypothetical protein
MKQSVSNANGLLVSDPVTQVVNVCVRFAAILWEKGRYVQQERLLGVLSIVRDQHKCPLFRSFSPMTAMTFSHLYSICTGIKENE